MTGFYFDTRLDIPGNKELRDPGMVDNIGRIVSAVAVCVWTLGRKTLEAVVASGVDLPAEDTDGYFQD